MREIAAAIEKAIPADEPIIALDRVLANVDKSGIAAKNVEGVKADPPPVFFSTTPAVIVNLDGEPIWSPIKENDLKFAVNTNWDLFQHGPTATYYLRHDASWLKATDIGRPVDARRHAARQLHEAAGRRPELEGRPGGTARQSRSRPPPSRASSSATSRRS